MEERTLCTWVLVGWLAIAAGAFIALLFKTAPYGRFVRPGWGPTIPARLSWALMESLASATMILLFAFATRKTATSWVFLATWNAHYIYRTWIFAPRIRTGRPVPLLITFSGVAFHLINGCLQGWYLFIVAQPYPDSWLHGERFWMGASLFVAGLVVNIRSDAALRSLPRPGETHYAIPRVGMFRLVSCPNYLGEMIEWIGWAVLTWSLPGLAMAVWTAANLLPRALACHRWYRATFPDYPPNRRAILPWVL